MFILMAVHVVVQQKLTQHYKAIIFPSKVDTSISRIFEIQKSL